MSQQYVVTGPCALLTAVSPLNGELYKSLLYRGALVPDTATDDEIAHNLDSGLIGPFEGVSSGDVVELTEPATGVEEQVVEPARNASTEDWRTYAIAKGAQAEDVADLKRDDLVDLYGTPA